MEAVIGTAGWSLAGRHAGHFPGEGTVLQRYAARFNGVEINSSFYRPHRLETWRRWADSVPESFRFSVKMPRTISHERRLLDCEAEVESFLAQVRELGSRLGVLLLQLPPKFAFEAATAGAFERLARAASTRLACEPRHPSWFEAEADRLLDSLEVARVAADPAVVPAAAVPGGWRGLTYRRLHGSPIIYRSSYEEARLESWAEQIRTELREGREAWCMFDNTLSAFATVNALALIDRL